MFEWVPLACVWRHIALPLELGASARLCASTRAAADDLLRRMSIAPAAHSGSNLRNSLRARILRCDSDRDRFGVTGTGNTGKPNIQNLDRSTTTSRNQRDARTCRRCGELAVQLHLYCLSRACAAQLERNGRFASWLGVQQRRSAFWHTNGHWV